jgi:nitrite reductase/ring-hydroxylating ferredoxin subunit
MPRYALAPIADVPANTPRAFEAGGQRIVVVNYEGKFYALDDLCPHLAVPLSRGEVNNSCIVCPGHGSVFYLETGQPTRWVGKSITWLTRLSEGRPQSAMCHRLTVEDDQLFVELQA